MFQLNRRPVGPDDILGGKLWQTSPADVGNVVSLGYDATDDYRAPMLGFVAQTLSMAAAGAGGTTQFSTLVVPALEWWWCEYFSIKAQIAATSSVLWFRPVIFGSPQGTIHQLFGPDQAGPVNTANGEELAVGWHVRQWLPPGSYFAVMTGPVVATGGNPNVTGSVRRMVYRA